MKFHSWSIMKVSVVSFPHNNAPFWHSELPLPVPSLLLQENWSCPSLQRRPQKAKPRTNH